MGFLERVRQRREQFFKQDGEEEWHHVVEVSFHTIDRQGSIKTRDGKVYLYNANDINCFNPRRAYTEYRWFRAEFIDGHAFMREKYKFYQPEVKTELMVEETWEARG